MRVTDFRVKKGPKTTVFSAQFSFRNKTLNQKVWFMIPNKYSRNVRPYNCFLVSATPLALKLGEDLYIDGPVSKKLYKAMCNLNIYLDIGYRKIKIITKGLEDKDEKGKNIGLFFSLGSDSFFSLYKNHKNKKEDKIEYLIFLEGIETFKPSNFLINKIKNGIRLVAEKSKTVPIFTKTNIRTLSDKIINWELYHGAEIAAAGLFFSSFIKKMYISSCDEYLINLKPYGSGNELDFQWSTESISYEPYGEKYCRAEKIIELCQSEYMDIIKNYLWTCWQKIKNKKLLNCSRCEKCIRTYLCFYAGGIQDLTPVLAKPKLNDLNQINISEDKVDTYETIYNHLKINQNKDKPIIKAVEGILIRKKRNLWLDYLHFFWFYLRTKAKKLYLRYATMLNDKLTDQHDHF